MAFKIGDLVKLKSGGPVMTVTDLRASIVETSWFAGAKNEKAIFKPEALEITTLEASKK
ncbi:YodC family protein [Rhizobium ruizarguesonis]|uniref:YodC family protein n=1 Tax=Rhizobium ruizarguesonis TaxID=2081791 RepID=UPI00103221DE|nr:DUF2158 domain-containing protein [Rhizobium ruizarguesonis]TBA16304.1 DUF2158 domain-containing protein [Rhizobium ruizarguesonis]